MNESQIDFAVVEGKIRFGLNAVKNVGETACRAIVAARDEGGPFTSIWDFTERVDPQVVNKRALESLVKCGALDSTGALAAGMLECLEQALAWGRSSGATSSLGQGSIFDLGEPARRRRRRAITRRSRPRSSRSPSCCTWRRRPSACTSPSTRWRRSATSCAARPTARSSSSSAGATARSSSSAGSSPSLKQLTTKKGDPMVFAALEDLTGSAEVVAFNSVYAPSRDLLVQDGVLIVKGRVDHKQKGETKLSRSRSPRSRRRPSARRCG